MKKLISVLVSAAMLVSVLCFATSVFAAGGVVSPEHPTQENPIVTEVNGNESDDIKVTKDPEDPTKITFEYTGDGELQGWEFPGMTEGKDYKIIYEEGNKITIQLLNDYDGKVIANAIVKNTTTSKKKSNGNKKSPKTGAATASAIAVAGAGVAILAVARKKNEE